MANTTYDDHRGESKMKISVIGTGYVGLVTGTCFAETGNDVICIDIDAAKVKKMQAGIVPIYEPGLEHLFERNLQAGKLHFTTNLAQGIKDASVIFLALPTPASGDGAADLSYVLDVADKLGPLIKHYAVVVDKSTVPVGTAEQVKKRIAKNCKVAFDVVSNPEFLQEGLAVSEFMKPDRIVIGTQSKRAQTIMNELYTPLLREGSPIYFMDERSAEMTKYAANSLLVTKISFMNEIANICERVGADVDAVRDGIGSDHRIGKHFLHAGIGYGGSCFPKDVIALRHTALEYDYEFNIIEAALKVNLQQRQHFVQKIIDYYNGNVEGKTFAVWGLAFKPNTDDIREAPALAIIQNLLTAGAKVTAYDPEAIANVRKQYKNLAIQFGEDAYATLRGADALIITTEWDEFKNPDFAKVTQLLKKPVIFDGRNMYKLETMRQAGFYYNSVGRKVISP
jgi:UDPglucose 6-dehydrogenase